MPVAEEHVRLDEFRLAEKEARTQTLLTPEGAQSWHKIDVTELLQEVRSLQEELRQARQCFVDDGVSDDGALPDLAQAWKDAATGVYEKAVNKRLRREAREAQRDADRARELKAAAEREVRGLADRLTGLLADQRYLQDKLERVQVDAKRAVSTELEKADALRSEVEYLHGVLADCKAQAEQQLAMSEALNAERLRQAVEHLDAAQELLTK